MPWPRTPRSPATTSPRALDGLRQAKSHGWNDPSTLEIDPDLEPIRKDPAFLALLADFRQTAPKHP